MTDRNLESQLLLWIINEREWVDVSSGYFSDQLFGSIYRNIGRSYKEHGVIETSLFSEDAVKIITAVPDAGSWPANIKPVVEELKKMYRTREAVRACSAAINFLKESPDNTLEVVGSLQTDLTRLISEAVEPDEYDHAKSVSVFFEKVQTARFSKKSIRGYRSHLPDIDILISGWERGRNYLITALEKSGKSRLVREIASHFLNDGLGGIFFQLEENAESVHRCMFASRCTVNTGYMGTDAISDAQIVQIGDEMARYQNQPLYVCEQSGITPEYAQALIQRTKVRFEAEGRHLDFAVWDHLLLMRGQGRNDDEKTTDIAQKWSDIGLRENLINIGIHQLVAGAERNEYHGPLWSLMKFGKVFREKADCIIALEDPGRGGVKKKKKKGETADEPETSNLPLSSKRIVAHILQREGISSQKINLGAQLQYSHFFNLDENHADT